MEHLVLDLFFVQNVLCFAAKLTALAEGLEGLLLILLLLMLDAADVLMRIKEGGALGVVVFDFGVCKVLVKALGLLLEDYAPEAFYLVYVPLLHFGLPLLHLDHLLLHLRQFLSAVVRHGILKRDAFHLLVHQILWWVVLVLMLLFVFRL